MGLGLGLGFGGGGAVASVLDPATLSLAGWYRASYSGAPWSGTASAGASGSKTLQDPGAVAPSVGAALNGFDGADFTGTKRLRDNVATTPSYISTTGYRVVVLARFDTIPAASGNLYTDPNIVCETGGNWGIGINATDGVAVFHHDGAYKIAKQSITTGVHLIDCIFTGTTLTMHVDAVAGTPVAAGTLGAIAAPLFVGANFNAAALIDACYYEIITDQTALVAATPAQLKAYVNARYALSL